MRAIPLIISFCLICTTLKPADCFLGFIGSELMSFMLDKVFSSGWDPMADFVQSKNDTTGAQLKEVISKLDALALDFKESMKDVKDHVSLELRSTKIQDIRERIDAKFTKIIDYMKFINELEIETMTDLSYDLSHGSDSVSNLIEQYHMKIFGNDSVYLDSHIKNIHDNEETFVTKHGESENVVLHQFYMTLIAFEYKALLLQKIAYFMKKKMGRGKFKAETKLIERHFKERVEASLLRMKQVFLNSNRILYVNDPKKHVKGVTYEEITRFNQVYFTQESNFGSCYSRCEDYAKPRYNYSESYHKYKQRQCRGTLSDCVGEHGTSYGVWTPNQDTDKRYYFVNRGDIDYADKTYGNWNDVKTQVSKQTYTAWQRGFVFCDICRCLCDESNDKKSVRFFNLNTIKSDTDKNMVVTGVQIILRNQIFCLKIQQAPLMPLGKINVNTTSWKEEKINLSDKLHKLEYNRKGIFIGTVEADIKKYPDFVLTAVQFDQKDGNLGIRVHLTRFNLTTGKLFDSSDKKHTTTALNIVKNNINTDRQFRDLPIKYNDNKSKTKSGIVQFRSSSLRDDVGQSTVPFIDLQPVTSTFVALSGVGIQFRDRKDSGGFIAPTLVTFPMFVENK
uniref:CSON005680 protein n=1 Tax=Culicoides sonorensis TaxID=179676 RepID=A0A336KFA7_CULSO